MPDTSGPAPTPPMSATRRGLLVGLAIVVGLPLLGLPFALRAWVIEAFQIPSGAMIPTLMIGDHIFVRKLGSLAAPGDVSVFKFPPDPQVDYVKRVMARGGDRIEMRAGLVYVNGRELPQKKLDRPCPSPPELGPCEVLEERNGSRSYLIVRAPDRAPSWGPTTVPAGHFFVMGDNRDNSNDSRIWGTVPAENMKGKARLIWWSRDPQGGTRWDRVGSRVR
jgi:signal peptidase I